jgi:hypothetical protein
MSRVKSQECRLALRGISGQYTMTDKAVAGWWRLAGARWSFMSNGQRDQMLAQAVGAWAQLAGATAFEKTRIHLRVTTRPYPAKQWASDYHAEAERRAQIPSMAAWDAHLKAAQRAMHRTVNLAGTEVYIGVDLAPRSLVAKARKGESAATCSGWCTGRLPCIFLRRGGRRSLGRWARRTCSRSPTAWT